MQTGEIETIFVQSLNGMYDDNESKALASIAIQEICHLSYGQLMLHKQILISPDHHAEILHILDELKKGIPLQYILQIADFYGHRFIVKPGVLIPRPETEELVDWILKEIQFRKWTNFKLVDIGTGTGCIPISIKIKNPHSSILGIDISDVALEIARQNAIALNADIQFLKVDILNENINFEPQSFDIIVSNPPYITTSEKSSMHMNVIQNEPHIALFVTDEDPLLFYRSIIQFALQYLKPTGLLFFEINEHLGDETIQLLKQYNFTAVLRKDISGKDRMIKAQIS
ncbi:Protein-N(5)-glutamine methyltransferase PrmC [Arcticibacter svalbardensis MN12-7]|uniref:peptide chain release factor N(5)-glutamine methyltransferase n=1 Tax=Arcticibacter svalbardensis MN12-7 TaxID=1150600 RepID=R9GPS6_9SPHI|nr:peptide chain release factor N(5)-glutamine methyltransferase [Arcticibacter svalbardensis]EOR93693.1 Protein-N(5)-glutamine methyltransferase PrmC [Arcticibacter svalbardensis MN12-7]